MQPAPDAARSRDTPVPPPPADRRTLVEEVLVVLWLSVLSRVAGAILSLLEAPLAGVVVAAADQSNAFARQVLGVAVGLAPVFLVLHLVRRSGEGLAGIGLRPDHSSADAARSAVLFVLVGLAGIGVYLAAVELGVNRCVVPVPPLGHWWTIPALVLSAVEAALVEEVIVLGYLITRLQQLSWSPAFAVGASALLRGSYHLYQGWGGFLGNLGMGLVFGVLFLRWGRRTWPFVVAHALLDIGAGVGFLLFRDSLPCF
ncbi:MAG TPA: type II CAAX endopeptidase family protein [Actinomycetota bacterium]|nr:type II CAAX endopeptidase family protein [Actinomycetota bacterium]